MRTFDHGKRRFCACALSLAAVCGTVGTYPSVYAQGQKASSSGAVSGIRILDRNRAGQLMPGSVFFAGHSTTVQERNSSGLQLQSGGVILAALVDTSGYASGLQQRYQAYLLTEAQLDFAGHVLAPGAYGCGTVQGQFVVMNIAGTVLFQTPSTRDTEIRRPVPLQFLAGERASSYRLYEGREYASFTVLP